tara:strand:- start:5325 stop:6101 length:777 start_codon:yes stop_codon:yes gene_type:complete
MIICEVGLNHLGYEEYSWDYIERLCKLDCDAITYQVREKDFYKKEFVGYDLSSEHYSEIIKFCQDSGKEFGVALADTERIDEFIELGVNFFKVLSWDLDNYSYIEKLLDTGKPISVSTGTSTTDDLDKFYEHFKEYDTDRIKLIHTQLSVEPEDTNLKAIPKIKERYPFKVSYGNHCKNRNIIYSAISFEPEDIWFYVTGDLGENEWCYSHPDEIHAIDLDRLQFYLNDIRQIQSGLGSGEKIKTNNKAWNKGLKGKL